MARTEITNTSGKERHFGYLPKHGRTLANDEKVVIDGDLRTILSGGGNRFSRASELASFQSDVDLGNINVVELTDPPGSSLAP